MPSVKLDSGVERRVEAYTTTSQFTTNPELVNEKKHIYLTDGKLINKFEGNPRLLNALFSILVKYANGWITKKHIYKQTKNFKDTKNEVVNSNDIIGDFIDRAITITGNVEDRIGKEAMYNQFKFLYPKQILTQSQLINQLKDRKIPYNCDLRSDKVKGCFLTVAFQKHNDVIYEAVEVEEKQTYTDDYVMSLLEKIKQLEQQLKEKDESIEEEEETEEEKEIKGSGCVICDEEEEEEEEEFQTATEGDEDEEEDILGLYFE
jgi:hypothetical protein